MILLYDGVCGLCDRTVQFLLRRDRQGVFRFASLQGPVARKILERHGRDPELLDTVYLVIDPEQESERLLNRSRAILTALSRLHSGWRLIALLRFLPAGPLDLGYDFVARRRYRWFGRLDRCRIPTADARNRFLDPDEPLAGRS